MVETLDLNRNTPAKQQSETMADNENHDAEIAHRHIEHEAMEAAKRAGKRMKKNESGNDIISK